MPRPAFVASPSDPGPSLLSALPFTSTSTSSPIGNALATDILKTAPTPVLGDAVPTPLTNGHLPSSSSSSPSPDEAATPSHSPSPPAESSTTVPGNDGTENSLASMQSLYQALPEASSSPQPGINGGAAYSAVGDDGYYGAQGEGAEWGSTALGLNVGGGTPFAPGGETKRTGNCKFFNAQKGFGFVVDHRAIELGNQEIFVHYSSIVAVQSGPGGFRSLLEVEYTIIQGPKGWQAQHVTGPSGAACIGTSPGLTPKSSVSFPYASERRLSSYEARNDPGRRPSGLTSAHLPPTSTRNRLNSSFSGYSSPSSASRSAYGPPPNRPMHYHHPGQPAYSPPFPGSPPGYQPLLLYPFGIPPAHPLQGALYPYPPPAGGELAAAAEGENVRPSQAGLPPSSMGAYGALPPPPGAIPISGADPRFLQLQTQGFPPMPGPDHSSPYSAYPISSSASSASTFLGSGPPSAYPISSQTSPAGQFLHPYPPPSLGGPHFAYPSPLPQAHMSLGAVPDGYPGSSGPGSYGSYPDPSQGYPHPAASGGAPSEWTTEQAQAEEAQELGRAEGVHRESTPVAA
ncbi:hypothetical protein JCM11641_003748 [Rhodosporidiobolus odoratus]